MRANEKKNFIARWDEYIGCIGTLAFVPDRDLSIAVTEHIAALKQLVPQIADSKIAASKTKASVILA